MSWSLVGGKLTLNKQLPQTLEGQIGVKVTHFGVSSLDTNIISRAGQNQSHSIGTAAYGIVDSVPSQLNGSFAVGDRVGVTTIRSNCETCKQCIQGRQNLCSASSSSDKFERTSYYSSNLSVNPQWLFTIPKSIPETSVVPILSEGVLVYSALKRYARPGDSIGIIGSKSFGQLAVAYSRALGYNTTLIAPQQQLSTFKIPQGVENGNDIKKFSYRFHLVLSTTKALDSETFISQFQTTRRGGRFVVLGSTAPADFQLPFGVLIHEQRQIIFLQSGSRSDVHTALQIASKSHIHPTVDVLPFESTDQAFKKIEDNQGGQQSIVIQI